jgi:hypothetical protein
MIYVYRGRVVTRDNLNDVMEFDHVIQIQQDGGVVDCAELYAPSVHTYEQPDGTWEDDPDEGHNPESWAVVYIPAGE